jgi:hypothetical protein
VQFGTTLMGPSFDDRFGNELVMMIHRGCRRQPTRGDNAAERVDGLLSCRP